jgi:P27 family predicted phage terminase small subunit
MPVAPSTVRRLRPPPAHLGAEGRAFWIATVRDYQIATESLLTQVQIACEALDRMSQCRRTVAEEGLTIADRHGTKLAHPLLKIEAANRAQFQSALRALRLQPGRGEK